jgi:GNAT superfamily N-acetyltransferase
MDITAQFNAAPPTVDGYSLAALTPEDGPRAQRLCERCADYSEMVMGVPPGPAEAQSLYMALPEGKTYEDKLLMGIFAGPEELVGVLDAVRDVPTSGMWWLGVLLLDPARRDQGLGTSVYRAFEQWAAAHGAQAIQLAVVQQNEAGHRFWQRLGFVEHRWATEYFGARASVFITMRRTLTVAAS